MRKPSKAWSKEEDKLLGEGVLKYKSRNWKAIAKYIGTRSHTQCFQRWHKVVNPDLKKGRWTIYEDKVLKTKALYQINSCKQRNVQHKISWGNICKSIKGRTAKQCRERWLNNVNPDIRRDEWTAEEDSIILKFQKIYPNRWAVIARELKGRTENSVKMRCVTLLRKDNNTVENKSRNRKRKHIVINKEHKCDKKNKKQREIKIMQELQKQLVEMQQQSLLLEIEKMLFLQQTSQVSNYSFSLY